MLLAMRWLFCRLHTIAALFAYICRAPLPICHYATIIAAAIARYADAPAAFRFIDAADAERCHAAAPRCRCRYATPCADDEPFATHFLFADTILPLMPPFY